MSILDPKVVHNEANPNQTYPILQTKLQTVQTNRITTQKKFNS